jgi:hypothetical protein
LAKLKLSPIFCYSQFYPTNLYLVLTWGLVLQVEGWTNKTTKKNIMTEQKISLTEQRMKQLDQVLKYYIDTKTSEHSFLQFASFGHEANNLDSIEEELREQNYIMKIGNGRLHTITEVGIIFWDNGRGGYLKPYLKERRKQIGDNIIKWTTITVAVLTFIWTAYNDAKLQKQEDNQLQIEERIYRLEQAMTQKKK